MSEKHSLAVKKYWASIDPVERSRRASLLAKRKHSMMTEAQKKKQILLMKAGRKRKLLEKVV
jgi:hypothetical protein